MTLLHLVGHDATNHGDDALALARTIGDGHDVRRLVVHVLPVGGPTYPVTDSWIDAQPPAVRARLDRVRDSLRGDETVEYVFAHSPARGLHDRAEEHAADLVVVGSHVRDPRAPVLGTVAGRMLSGGPCAVAHAPAGYAASAHTLSRIVVGFDGSPESHDALGEAAALAVATGAVVDVVSAHDPTAHILGFPGAVSVTPTETHEAQRAAEQLAGEGLDAMPVSVRGISAGRSGTPGATIELFATQQDADLVVLGSRGYGPLRRALLGSTGSHVLHHTDRPVLVLPRGVHAIVAADAHGFPVAP